MKKTLLVAVATFLVLTGIREMVLQVQGLVDFTRPRIAKRGSERRRTSLAAMAPVIEPIRLPRARNEDEAPREVGALPTPSPLDSAKALEASATAIADGYIASHRSKWNLQEHHELRPQVFRSPLGTEVKYLVYQNGIPVLGMEIRVGIGNDNTVTAVQNSYVAAPKVDLSQPSLDYLTILERHGRRFSMDTEAGGVSRVLMVSQGSDEAELAFSVPVRENAENRRPGTVVFRASDGRILSKQFSRVEF